ncbi:MAG TPA: TlpA disulfide reductase family protein [Acidimicrobiales bacterium]|jgi:peroxiredoxin
MTESADPTGGPTTPERRPPRKRFLLIGCGLAVALGIGLLTTASSGPKSQSAPQVGHPVPSFTTSLVRGSGTVSVPGESGGAPTVLLFFGNWCPGCHQELPPLAAAVRAQVAGGGPLSNIEVIGVDSEDNLPQARAFVKSSGVTFPVAYDRNEDILSGDFYFEGDPNAVFVRSNGTIARIVHGDELTPSAFIADERALIPSGT